MLADQWKKKKKTPGAVCLHPRDLVRSVLGGTCHMISHLPGGFLSFTVWPGTTHVSCLHCRNSKKNIIYFWNNLCRTLAYLGSGRWFPPPTTDHSSSSPEPFCRAPWLRGRAMDSRLREAGFEFCAAVLKPWASFFTQLYK